MSITTPTTTSMPPVEELQLDEVPEQHDEHPVDHEQPTSTSSTGAVRLAAGHVACAWCGVDAGTATTMNVELTGVTMQSSYTPKMDVDLGMCDECRLLEEHARALVLNHPIMASRFGPSGAYPLAVGVVVTHAVLGHQLPAVNCPDDELGLLVRNLKGAHVALHHARLTRDLVGLAAPSPWALVTDSVLTNLRAAWADVVAERLAAHQPPVRVLPPAVRADALARSTYPNPVEVRRGCLFCGVDHVEVPAVDAVRMSDEQLTARCWSPASMQRAHGHLCPACAEARDLEGAVGPSAVERALLAFLDLGNRIMPETTFDGLTTFGQLVVEAHDRRHPAPQPNREPFGHLGTREELAAGIAADLGVATITFTEGGGHRGR